MELLHGVSWMDVVGSGVVVLPVNGGHQEQQGAGDHGSKDFVNKSNVLHVLMLVDWSKLWN